MCGRREQLPDLALYVTEEAEELGLVWDLDPNEPLAKYQFGRLELRLRSLIPTTKVLVLFYLAVQYSH